MRSTSPTGLQSEGIPQNLLQLSPVTQNKCNSSLQIITPNIRKQLQFPFLFTRLFTFFILFMGFSRQKYWSYLPFPSWWEEVTHWKRPWSWERLTAGGKDWRQEEKGTMEDEMVGWHHWPDGHEFEQTPGDGVGWGSLACCSPWGPKELDIMERLNNNILLLHLIIICLSLLEYKMKEIFFLLLYPRSFLVHNSCWINIWGIIA